jgi:indole-3-glycerol phosphate synthase
MSSLLAAILAQKAEDVAELRGRRLPAPPERRPVILSYEDRLGLIAEIKRRSPSAGPLSTVLGVAERARAYEDAGADMVSVLTDARFFDGAFEHLHQARGAAALPILCKDFVIDEVQLDAARAWGADVVLLIVRCLAPARLVELLDAAHERELEALVEVANADEARVALEAGATIIGVNARDLDTLAIDRARAAAVIRALPASVVAVHLSGLATAADVLQLEADAALVGEALMRQADPRALLSELVSAAKTRGPARRAVPYGR